MAGGLAIACRLRREMGLLVARIMIGVVASKKNQYGQQRGTGSVVCWGWMTGQQRMMRIEWSTVSAVNCQESESDDEHQRHVGDWAVTL
jgi:hypothetical protein